MSKVLHISSKYLYGADIDSSRVITSIKSKYGDYIATKGSGKEPTLGVGSSSGIICTDNDQLTVPLVENIDYNDLMHGGWVKFTASSVQANFVSFQGWNTIGRTSGNALFVYITSSYVYPSGISIADDEWCHLLYIRQSGYEYITFNGILIWTRAEVSKDWSTSGTYYINNSNQSFVADDVMFELNNLSINFTGYAVGDRVFNPPNRYSGVFTPQKDVINLDAKTGKIYGTSPAIESWMGNNSLIKFNQSNASYKPTYNSTEKALEFTDTNPQYLLGNKGFDYSQPFICSFYMKFKTPSGNYDHILNQFDHPSDSANYLHCYMSYLDGKMYFNLVQDGSVSNSKMHGTGNISSLTWYHFLFFWNGEVMNGYVDGKLFLCKVITGITTYKDIPLDIGFLEGVSTDNHALNGYLDDFSIKHQNIERFNAWNGSVLKYSYLEQVFTPPPRT